jgi:hypothetical protein
VRRTSSRRCALAAAAVTALSVGPASAALAAWSAPGSGSAAGAAAVMPTGATPSGSPAGTSVTLSWAPATLSNGIAVAGYVVARFNASNGTPVAVGSGCSGVLTTTTCTEQSVQPGTWVYTDTPVQLTWTGGASGDSTPVVVT